MKPNIKTLITVSILALAIVCVSANTYAQPRDKSEPRFNTALERAGPITITQLRVAADIVAPDIAQIDTAMTARPELETVYSLSIPVGVSREAFAKRGFQRVDFNLRE